MEIPTIRDLKRSRKHARIVLSRLLSLIEENIAIENESARKDEKKVESLKRVKAFVDEARGSDPEGKQKLIFIDFSTLSALLETEYDKEQAFSDAEKVFILQYFLIRNFNIINKDQREKNQIYNIRRKYSINPGKPAGSKSKAASNNKDQSNFVEAISGLYSVIPRIPNLLDDEINALVGYLHTLGVSVELSLLYQKVMFERSEKYRAFVNATMNDSLNKKFESRFKELTNDNEKQDMGWLYTFCAAPHYYIDKHVIPQDFSIINRVLSIFNISNEDITEIIDRVFDIFVFLFQTTVIDRDSLITLTSQRLPTRSNTHATGVMAMQVDRNNPLVGSHPTDYSLKDISYTCFCRVGNSTQDYNGITVLTNPGNMKREEYFQQSLNSLRYVFMIYQSPF